MKPNSRDDLSGNARRIKNHVFRRQAIRESKSGHDHDQASADAHDHMSADASRPQKSFALEPDNAPKNCCRKKAADDVEVCQSVQW
jgi:hypothetical protein